ncbi:MAG TPA: glycosyltransferase family 39 protein [Bryobacterales bacterium]|nr:glycosyltransferase family 39 protein [Bryobacterales bacterium]
MRTKTSSASWGELPLCLLCAAAVSASFVWFCLRRGYTLYYGDAASHINIARRVIDSRTPGYGQLGTVWLPLPHALMLPLVRNDRLWQTGLAGAIPAAAFFVAGVVFLFAAVRRATGSRAAAVTAAAALGLNPNLLYLQATPMTEPVFLGCFLAAVFCGVSFQAAPRLRYVLGAGVAVLAGSLTRYDGWFLIPFVALFFGIAGSWKSAAVFSFLAALGPLYWLGHNWVLFQDPLEFYRGPYSAQAIYARALAKGLPRYPGDHDFRTAWMYYRRAMELVMGRPLVWIAAAGGLAALARKATRPLALLALLLPFYVLSLHSGGTPIFVPKLYPYSYYNSRYALAALPAGAAFAGALVALVPASFLRGTAAAALLVISLGGWALHPSVENWLCWKESEVNSEGRRHWTRQAAGFFRRNYQPGDGILTASGDVLAVYQEAGIHLRETLTDGDFLEWLPAVNRPDLFLHERWVVAIAGDPISFNLTNPHRFASLCERVAVFSAPREPVIEVYRKIR